MVQLRVVFEVLGRVGKPLDHGHDIGRQVLVLQIGILLRCSPIVETGLSLRWTPHREPRRAQGRFAFHRKLGEFVLPRMVARFG